MIDISDDCKDDVDLNNTEVPISENMRLYTHHASVVPVVNRGRN